MTTAPARLVYRLLLDLGAVLTKLVWRVEVFGRDRIPSVGSFVVCPVHRSNVDFVLTGVAMKRRVRFMAKSSLWRSARLGRFLEAMGAFPVHRDQVDRTALRLAEECMERGEPVVMFPEGRRREGPVVKQLHEGPAFVACRARVPLIPVAIGGSARALPMGAKMIRPAKVRIVIGEPIYPDVPLTGRIPRRLVAQTSEELHASLQSLYDQVR